MTGWLCRFDKVDRVSAPFSNAADSSIKSIAGKQRSADSPKAFARWSWNQRVETPPTLRWSIYIIHESLQKQPDRCSPVGHVASGERNSRQVSDYRKTSWERHLSNRGRISPGNFVWFRDWLYVSRRADVYPMCADLIRRLEIIVLLMTKLQVWRYECELVLGYG